MSLSSLCSRSVPSRLIVLIAVLTVVSVSFCPAQAKPAAADVLMLNNGDTIHGKLVSAIDGTITFHSDALGDLKVKWSDVKELHSNQSFAVLNKSVNQRSRKQAAQIPMGPIDMENQTVTVHAKNGAVPPPVPVADAAYVVDQATVNQQVYHHPSFLGGWNGAATAGATIVAATQNQDTVSGSVSVVRIVPGVSWLNPRNRTLADFSGSYGKITQPGVPTIKTAIYHADAERDKYFSTRFYGLGQVAFDHNFGQLLALQSIFGGGVGFTVFKDAQQELDVKGTIQYEKQQFLAPPPPGILSPSRNLIGSTFAASYALKLKLFSFMQGVAYIPAYNTPSAYSANETDTLSFPTYKNFSFSVGTLDSYLNDPPLSTPPTKANSFQFTMGLTYAIKSKY